MRRTFFLLLVGFSLIGTGFSLPAEAATPTIRADMVLAYTNLERYREDAPLLRSDPQLSAAAMHKMQDLFARQYFAHEAPTGEDVSNLVKATGYAYIAVGENLALGDFSSSKDVVDAWMDSPGHRKNILSTKYSQIGIAAGRGDYKGRSTWIVVQTFALPRSACPSLDDEAKAELTSSQKTLELLERVASVRKELLDDKDVTKKVYASRVDAYNRAVELYNERVEEYRELVATYNKSVDTLNTCIAQRTKES